MNKVALHIKIALDEMFTISKTVVTMINHPPGKPFCRVLPRE
jgi:hypothetical protein